MSKIYTTIQGDTLDQICAAYYGYTSGTVEAVLAANDGLADLGPVYEAGVEITLPDVNTSTAASVSLFGSTSGGSCGGSDSSAEELVKAHNSSPTAHPDIRASLKTRMTATDVVKVIASARRNGSIVTGTVYTLALSDAGGIVEFTSTDAVTVTVTAHSTVAFSARDRIDLVQGGTGQITITAASGVSIISTKTLKSSGITGAVITLVRSASGDNVWYLSGERAE